MGDDALGEALVAAAPEMAGILEDHRRDHGRVRAAELFGDALRFSASEWSAGRPTTLGQVLVFMDSAFASGDERARACVMAGFIDPIAAAASSPSLDAFLATWPERLRGALEGRRSARRQLVGGLWIEHADDLEVLWVVSDGVEAVASDGDALYIVGDSVNAIRVADGRLRWRYDGHKGSPLHASGGVTLTRLPDGRLEVFAPFEYVLHLDAATGDELRWRTGTGASETPVASPLPDFPLRDFDVSVDDRTVRVESDDGFHLATLTVSEPSYDPLPPMQIDDVLVLSLASGHVLGIRRT